MFLTFFKDKDYRNHSIGPAAITDGQAEGPEGKENLPNGDRGTGLGLRNHECKFTGCEMDQNDYAVAFPGMRKRIELRLDKCNQCTASDKFLAAILAADEQVSPTGLLQALGNEEYTPDADIKKSVTIDWKVYIQTEHDPDQFKDMIDLFTASVLELAQQGYYVPPIDWNYVNTFLD